MNNFYQVSALKTYRTLCQTGGEDSLGMYCASRRHDQPVWSGGRKQKMGQGKVDMAGYMQRRFARKHGRIHAEKICKKCVSAAVTLMKPGALPLIGLNGDDSSPSVPVGTGGPKSK